MIAASAQTEEIKAKLRNFFKGKPVEKVELFGSAARGEMKPDSDVDLLITPTSEATLDDILEMAGRVEDAVGRHVDVLVRPWVEVMKNERKKKAILEDAVIIYGV